MTLHIGLAIVLVLLANAASAATVTLAAVRDTTLFSENTIFSNGAGDSIFAGRTGGSSNGLRRALLAFDIAGAVPAGAVIDAVTLTLHVVQAGSASAPAVALQRAVADWGEAASASSGGGGAVAQPGDATWTSRVHPGTPWSTPGGDFVATQSASVVVGGVGAYTWSTSSMAADVQAWLDTPADNFGWLLRGDESRSNTSRRFGSREGADVVVPALSVTFTPVPEPATAGILAIGLVLLCASGRKRLGA